MANRRYLDMRMREYVYDRGARIDRDGMIYISPDRWSKMWPTGVSQLDPSVHLWMVDSEVGSCILVEWKHFIIGDMP